ncbi:protein sip5 [Anaeramoeba ignava]|uniref:Protein sip5 n=1 Tax=Anaeramoeba ignava TaxID=1746090 RepID=A0A9Q0LE92_ANAIG|nr:protein sip5 [Anaeramoeba ignava]
MGNNNSKQAHKIYTKSTGIYEKIKWNENTVKKRIFKKELAPLYPPESNKTETTREECPICFYFYPTINLTNCCQHSICSECFLQITPNEPTKDNLCPFCQKPNFTVKYTGNRPKEEVLREEENQKQIEQANKKAQIRESRIRKQNKEVFKKIVNEQLPRQKQQAKIMQIMEENNANSFKTNSSPLPIISDNFHHIQVFDDVFDQTISRSIDESDLNYNQLQKTLELSLHVK